VLATLSLRQWEASAERHVHEQARDMATMCVEKIEAAVLKAEEEALGSLRQVVLDPDFAPERPERVQAWLTRTPFFEAAYLVDRQGTVLYPPPTRSEGSAMLARKCRRASGTARADVTSPRVTRWRWWR
jgi:hypothetical protein